MESHSTYGAPERGNFTTSMPKFIISLLKESGFALDSALFNAISQNDTVESATFLIINAAYTQQQHIQTHFCKNSHAAKCGRHDIKSSHSIKSHLITDDHFSTHFIVLYFHRTSKKECQWNIVEITTMSTLEQEFNNQIRDISNEGIRLKKFRQSVIQNFLGERLESDLKKEFASILENFTADGRVILDGGMVMKGKVFVPAANVSKKRKTMSDDLKLDELEQLTPMQIAVTEALNELTEEVRLKKFRKAVFSRFQNIDEEQLKSDFASTFEEFCSRGDAKETDGMVRRLCDVKVIRKPKKVLERVDVSEARKELWKYGEQTWADGTLDQDYLAENPDGITRLFCGNLKKTITEDDLHNAINGITHIKWMTDKVTREFYGSTFIEMKDPRAAAAAVMLDKTKLLGR